MKNHQSIKKNLYLGRNDSDEVASHPRGIGQGKLGEGGIIVRQLLKRQKLKIENCAVKGENVYTSILIANLL